MKRSRRELSIDMVVHRDIFENNQITLFRCFTVIPKSGVSFYSMHRIEMRSSPVLRYLKQIRT